MNRLLLKDSKRAKDLMVNYDTLYLCNIAVTNLAQCNYTTKSISLQLSFYCSSLNMLHKYKKVKKSIARLIFQDHNQT